MSVRIQNAIMAQTFNAKVCRHTNKSPGLAHLGVRTPGINPFNGFLPATRCHPFRYLIKLVNWLSCCWTHRGSQLFVSLSKSNWLRLCCVQPLSHPVSLFPLKVIAGIALSQSQIRFCLTRKHLHPKSTILPLSQINNLWIIMCGNHSVTVLINLMFIMYLVCTSDQSYLLSVTQR